MNEPVFDSLARGARPHALISGGGRGIGAACAHELDAIGARVTLLGRDRGALEKMRAQLRDAVVVSADVTDGAAIAAAVAEARAAAGPITILINNAGVAESAPFLRMEQASWSRMFTVNVDGVANLCRAVLPDMLSAGWGRIVNIASTAGLRGYAYVSGYCASKHAVVGLTRALAVEFVQKGITVNAVCPGYVETEMLTRSLQNIVDKTGCTIEEAAAQLRSVNPQRRFIQPAEIARTVRWLCLPGAESVTGQAIALAGGEIQ
jgi:2-hydroxycyclohexanecarboxyl-CoA dehydrogenase